MEKHFKRGDIVKRFSQKHKAIIVKPIKTSMCTHCGFYITDELKVRETKGGQTLGDFHINCFEKKENK